MSNVFRGRRLVKPTGVERGDDLIPEAARSRIEQAIDAMGRDLGSFSHYRITGGNRYRLRVGDYRVVYTFDVGRNEIHLLAVDTAAKFTGEAQKIGGRMKLTRRL